MGTGSFSHHALPMVAKLAVALKMAQAHFGCKPETMGFKGRSSVWHTMTALHYHILIACSVSENYGF
jgi:hypothetical protein